MTEYDEEIEAPEDAAADEYGDEAEAGGEEAAAEEEVVENPAVPYFGYGAVALWSVVYGFLLNGWYAGRLTTAGSFWAANCPATAYTATTYNAAGVNPWWRTVPGTASATDINVTLRNKL